jgi:hypothetical protein
MLNGYDLNGDVSRIAIQVFETDRDPVPADPTADDAAPDNVDVLDGPGSIPETDRSLKGISRDSSYHLVLMAIDQLDATSVDRDDIASAMGLPAKNVSTALSKMFKRKLLDRNDDVLPFQYQMTDHGTAILNELGRDVDRDDVGGIWSESDG